MDNNLLIYILVSVLSIILHVDGLCNDLDAKACTDLKALMPDMCQDMCIANACRRTCNVCPLQCLHCQQTFYPEECTVEKECQGGEVCVAIQELSQDFLPLYYSDCMSQSECLQIFGGINTGVKRRSLLEQRDYALNGSCCDHDLCNKHETQNTPTEPPNVSIRPTPPTKDYGNTCGKVDKSVDICKAILKADPLMCSKPCFSQEICPQTCQTCNTCYQCVNVNDPTECTKSRLCNIDQHCMSIHTLDDNFQPTFKLGCASTNICHQYFGGVNLPSSVVVQPVAGKRQVGIGSEGKCCDTPYCNGPAPNTTAPSSTVMNMTTAIPQGTTTTTATTTAAAAATTPKGLSTTLTVSTNPATTALPSATTELVTLTFPPEVTIAPDLNCPDESNMCNQTTQSILCDKTIQSRLDYAIRVCASTCNLCDEYYKWKNATMTATTSKPCLDDPKTACFSLYCLDQSQRGQKFVMEHCPKFCGLCS